MVASKKHDQAVKDRDFKFFNPKIPKGGIPDRKLEEFAI